MAGKVYTKQEKILIIDAFKSSGMSQNAFARAKEIPETTFKSWLRLDKALAFGEIDVSDIATSTTQVPKNNPITIKKSIIFAKDDIRIELKEGFDKELLKNITEVLMNVN